MVVFDADDGRDKRLDRRASAEKVWDRVTNVRPTLLNVKAEAYDVVVEDDMVAKKEANKQDDGANFMLSIWLKCLIKVEMIIVYFCFDNKWNVNCEGRGGD